MRKVKQGSSFWIFKLLLQKSTTSNMIRRLLIFLVVQTITAYTLNRVKFAAVVFRHGDRMPVDCYPADPYKNQSYWPLEFGQLTNIGKRQQFMLGKYLRDHYGDLLSEFYIPKEIMVQSTDVDRTLMSAEANLAGMYPPAGDQVWDEAVPWQPIPVHTKPERRDEILAMKKPCPSYASELAKYLASVTYLDKLSSFANFMEYLSNHTGMPVRDFTDMMLIYSCLNIETLYNFTLPAWTRRAYPQPLKDAAGLSFTVSAATPRLARLSVGPLVQQVVRAMDAARRGSSERRLLMYSGHDFTVGTLLTALGVFDAVCPEYTATVFLELLHDDARDTADEWSWAVQVLYRNSAGPARPVPLALPGCGALCPYPRFVQLYENLITVDWERECYEGLPEPEPESVVSELPSSMLLASLLLNIGLACALLLLCVSRTKSNPEISSGSADRLRSESTKNLLLGQADRPTIPTPAKTRLR